MDNYTTLQSLHERGVHLVLCDGKVAVTKNWQKNAPSLQHVLEHKQSGGALGFVPGVSGLWVLDVDNSQDVTAIKAGLGERGAQALAMVGTKRGCHVYFKKNGSMVRNRQWAYGGFQGDVRGDRGYCIAWEPEALLDALDALEQAIPTDDKLFPKPDKAAGPQLVEGNRNNELNTLIFRKAQAGQTAFTEERAVAIASGLDAAEVDATIRSASEAASKKRAPTEHDVALSFTERYRDTFRYCPDLRRWFGWDNTRWRPDTLGRAFHRARELCSEASKARAVRKAGFARGVEAFCQADPAHAVAASYWDADPWKLGTPGGTLDLEAGRVLEADPAHRITKLTAVGPSKAGECPRWLQFLDECTGSDPQLVEFLQRWAGYCLTGSVQEHALVFIYGPGGTGKSVFLSVLSGVLGDYSTTAAMDVLTATKYSDHPTEIAVLAGARLVTASETDEGRSWSEARVKTLTGGDRLSARFMRQDYFEFDPTFKLMLSANTLPNLRDSGTAMRRRFRVVPFDKIPESVDLELGDKLKSEWPGILAWAIEGCALWRKAGLGTAARIEAETNRYFDESDHFGGWLESCCELCEPSEGYELATLLFTSWNKYLTRIHEPEENSTRFGRRLRALGLDKHKAGTVRWHGIRLNQLSGHYPA